MRSTAQALKLAYQQASRELATRAPKDRKVAVLGAAGGIGQPLSLLMKVRGDQCPEYEMEQHDLTATPFPNCLSR